MNIAHKDQIVEEHLVNVSKLAYKNAEKIACGVYGEILGLLHDFGKYSADFQKYIKDAIRASDIAPFAGARIET